MSQRGGDPPVIGVGVIGSTPMSRYFGEILTRHRQFQLVLTNDSSSPSSEWIAGDTATDIQVLFFSAKSSFESIMAAIRSGRTVILEMPSALSVSELETVSYEAASLNLHSAAYMPRRWDAEFLQVRSAVEGGRMGKLVRLRYSVHEQQFPGEEFPGGIVGSLAWPVVDQMLQLLRCGENAFPSLRDATVLERSSEGIAVSFRFGDSISAIIEIQVGSFLGTRSGWLIEGTTGACRNGRLFTRAADGEIVDESIPMGNTRHSSFLEELRLAVQGQASRLPMLEEALTVKQLLSTITNS